MKKIILSAAFVAAIVLGASAEEYKHVAPILIQRVEFNLDTMRNATDGNLDMYLTNLASLQTDIERQGKEIGEAQKNLKSEKKLYDTQMSFLKSRQGQLKSQKKFYESEIKNYDAQLKNIKKQYEMIQKMSDISSSALQEQLSVLRNVEQDTNDGKARAQEALDALNKQDSKMLDQAYEMLSQYLIEINDKTTRLENLALQNKNDVAMVKAQIKNIKEQAKGK